MLPWLLKVFFFIIYFKKKPKNLNAAIWESKLDKITVTAKFKILLDSRNKKTTTHRSNQQIKCQSNKRGICFPIALWCIHVKLFIHQQQQPFLLWGKKPSKTQINQKAIFQYVKFLLFYNLSIKNKIPINQLQTKIACTSLYMFFICSLSLFKHFQYYFTTIWGK